MKNLAHKALESLPSDRRAQDLRDLVSKITVEMEPGSLDPGPSMRSLGRYQFEDGSAILIGRESYGVEGAVKFNY